MTAAWFTHVSERSHGPFPVAMNTFVKAQAARILIASCDARTRSALMNVVSDRGDLEVAGFIRSENQLLDRSLRIMPDMLVIDAKLLIAACGKPLTELARALPKLKVVIYGIDSIAVSLGQELRETKTTPHLVTIDAGEHDDFRALRATLDAAFHPVPATHPSVPAKRSVPATASRNSAPHTTIVARPVPKMLVVASSTGGPEALTRLVQMLPGDFPLPIAVVQHMPPKFTTMLAERLNSACALEVVEATEGMEVRPGKVIISPGDFHMKLTQSDGHCRVELDSGERECSCRPAANVLFRSAADLFGGRVLAVVLTGMGRDGFDGARRLRELGSRIIVQDEATSTVWGMPGAIALAGLADAVLPLTEIAHEVMRFL